MNAKVVAWQLISTDAERSAKFYSQAFGWRVDRANGLGYRMVDGTQAGVPGGIWPAPPGATSFVQLFLAVEDVDAALAHAVSLGATVVVPKSVLPDGDVMAVLCDPAGASFGLVQSK
jgi:predicted enzyme related to lactoylglutathione lyase